MTPTEELIKYVLEKAHECYSDDFPIDKIGIWIREFFEEENENNNPDSYSL